MKKPSVSQECLWLKSSSDNKKRTRGQTFLDLYHSRPFADKQASMFMLLSTGVFAFEEVQEDETFTERFGSEGAALVHLSPSSRLIDIYKLLKVRQTSQWRRKQGGTGAAAPLTFYLGGRNIIRPPLKTAMVTLCKMFSNFFHHTYLPFKIKISI